MSERRRRVRRTAVWPAGAVTVALVATLAPPASAQSVPPPGAPVAEALRIEEPPVIDGVLDEAVWAEADVLNGFVQNEPFDGEPVTERTEVRVLWDEEALYVGAWLFDRDPSAIVVGETRRDASLENTDALLLIFDTYLDRQNGFVFGTTPAGIEYDGQLATEGQGGFNPQNRQQRGSGAGFNLNWDADWDVATSVDGRGWFAELRIPFSTLRYGQGGAQAWGLNISRNIRRRNEQAFWAAVPRQYDLYRVSLAGTLQGFDAPAQRTVTATPYVLASGSRDFDAGTDTDFNGEAGGELKVGLTPGLTLDLTVNTDFAQVEVDDEQINLTRFPLFFPEKRPFFLENAGTFSVGTPQAVEMFFSRRIGLEAGTTVPIVAGGRMSGKVGGVTVGLLNIQTDDVEGLVNPNNFGAVRLAQELPNRTRVGGIVVSRLNTDDTGDYNLTYAVDARVGIGDPVTLDGFVARTETPGLEGRQDAFSVSASFTTRDWNIAGTYREVGESFNPEVGFLQRNSERFRSFRILRHVRVPSVAWFRELRPHVSYRENLGLEDGLSETRLIHVDNHFEFANGAFFQLPALNFTREGLREPFQIAEGVVVPAGVYDNVEWAFRYNSDLSAPISLQGGITIGGFLSGHRWGGEATASTRFLESSLIAAVRVSYDNVDLPEGAFERSLASVRIAYSFSPRVYLQSLVQYSNQTDTFSGNVRFGWLNAAGTGLFLVYNDIERTVSPTGEALGLDEWRPVNRTFVVKFTQLFTLTM